MSNASVPGINAAVQEDAAHLADFILFSQRNCILQLSPTLTEAKVSYPQFFLLAYLEDLAPDESISMGRVAKMMGHSTAAATGMIDKLQVLGMIQRVMAASDRRKIMVRITEKGRELVQQMRGRIAGDLARMMAEPDTRATLAAAGRKISRNQGSPLF